MPQPSIPAVLVEGFNELCDLLARRAAAQFEPEYTPREIAELDDRISSQRVGMLADADTCADLVESALRGGDPRQVLGAVHLILVSRHERAADIVIETLLRAHEPEQLNALCQALIRSPIDGLPLGLVLDAASPEVASVIMLALAAHGRVDACGENRVKSLLSAESPDVRARGWQIVSLIGV